MTQIYEKGRVYVTGRPGSAPPGATVRQGERGGLYYDADSAGRPAEQQPAASGRSLARGGRMGFGHIVKVDDTWTCADQQGTLNRGKCATAYAKPGTFDPVPGLSDSRMLIKASKVDRAGELQWQQLDEIMGWGLHPGVYQLTEEKRFDGMALRWVDDAGFGGKARLAQMYDGEISEAMVRDYSRMVVMDLMLGNWDRHGANFIVDPENDRLWAIDNAGRWDDPTDEESVWELLKGNSWPGLEQQLGIGSPESVEADDYRGNDVIRRNVLAACGEVLAKRHQLAPVLARVVNTHGSDGVGKVKLSESEKASIIDARLDVLASLHGGLR